MDPITLEILESQSDPIIPQCILEVFLGNEKQIPKNQLNHNITTPSETYLKNPFMHKLQRYGWVLNADLCHSLFAEFGIWSRSLSLRQALQLYLLALHTIKFTGGHQSKLGTLFMLLELM